MSFNILSPSCFSFHDCIRYADGTGGCDGCLNWHGVGHRYGQDPKKASNRGVVSRRLENKFGEEDLTETNNNGLEYVAAILERLYTDPDFPKAAQKLPSSLKSTGKSRADLWAFAAKVAIEFTTEVNNYECEDSPSLASWLKENSYLGKPKNLKDCLRNVGEADCKVNWPSEINFQYGRVDCVSEYPGAMEKYKTDKPEKHPNLNGNGDDTIDFFHEEFGFSARDTAAIMGAHTLGSMHIEISLLKYIWTTRAGNSFNNAYYKNIVRKTDWFFEQKVKEGISF